MNVELLEKIKAEILKRPAQFYMGSWSSGNLKDLDHSCGTTACIAGWACFLGNDFSLEFIPHRARRLLELDSDQGGRLFHVSYWPDGFAQAYNEAQWGDDDEAARIAAARIDHFIATNGAE